MTLCGRQGCHAGDLRRAAVSRLASWPHAQALQDRLPPSTRACIPTGMAAWGTSPVGWTRAHVCWHLASVTVSSQKRSLRAAHSSQEMDVRAGHPPGRYVPSLLPSASASPCVRRWRWVDGAAERGRSHPPCSSAPVVSPALLPVGRAGLKRGPKDWGHQSSGSGSWHPLLARGARAARRRCSCPMPSIIKQHKTIKLCSALKVRGGWHSPGEPGGTFLMRTGTLLVPPD